MFLIFRNYEISNRPRVGRTAGVRESRRRTGGHRYQTQSWRCPQRCGGGVATAIGHEAAFFSLLVGCYIEVSHDDFP